MNTQYLLDNIWPGWSVEDLIGHGQYGRVFRIKKREYGRELQAALKVIEIPSDENEIRSMKATGMDEGSIRTYMEETARSLKKEIDLMQELKGASNIVTIEDSEIIGKEEGIGWIILIRMELLESLTQRMQERKMTAEDCVQLGLDICSAITDCEKAGIIHRDIKPENIFVNKFGTYKLGDFGIARKLEQTRATMSKKGTELYMAPEVTKGEKYDGTVDIYSLGIMMYRFLNRGRMPFYPPYPEKLTPVAVEEALARKNRGEAFPKPADADEELGRILLKACEYDPARRYRRASEMAADLRSWKTGIKKTLQDIVLPKQSEDIRTGPGPGVDPQFEAPAIEEPDTAPASGPDEPVGEDAVNKSENAALPGSRKKAGFWIPAVLSICAVLGLIIAIPKLKGEETQPVPPEEPVAAEESGAERTNDDPADGKTIKFSVGGTHLAELKDDGTVTAYGGNHNRQCSVNTWTGVTDIVTGPFHTVGLMSDGSVSATGSNELGQCNVKNWTDIVAIDAGYYHTVGLRSDGTVAAVGENVFSQCRVHQWDDITAVCCGVRTTFGLRSDGTVVAAGNGDYGQCDVSDWKDIVGISTFETHTVGLRSDGTVVATGNNNKGQCNVEDWTDIVAVDTGRYHTVGLRSDGTVVAAGDNDNGQCDVGSWTDIVAVKAVDQITLGIRADGSVAVTDRIGYLQSDVGNWSEIIEVDAVMATNGRDYYIFGLKSDGTVLRSEYDEYGQFDIQDWSDLVQICSLDHRTVVLRSDGTVVAAGKNYSGECNVDAWTDIVSISAAEDHTVGLCSGGTVKSTGENGYGQCNTESWTDITAVAAGRYHTVGLKTDGTVTAVGWNEYGQCDVGSWTDITAVAAGDGYTIGLKSDGSLVRAGINREHAGDIVDCGEPLTAISTNYFHNVGLRLDGTVEASGNTAYGACDVNGWTDIVAVSAGYTHTVGLKSDGTVVAAGNNMAGQCEVGGWSDIVAVFAGTECTFGIRSDGEVLMTHPNYRVE